MPWRFLLHVTLSHTSALGREWNEKEPWPCPECGSSKCTAIAWPKGGGLEVGEGLRDFKSPPHGIRGHPPISTPNPLSPSLVLFFFRALTHRIGKSICLGSHIGPPPLKPPGSKHSWPGGRSPAAPKPEWLLISEAHPEPLPGTLVEGGPDLPGRSWKGFRPGITSSL